MYEEYLLFEKPKNENIKIWRYMDFTKFVSLLDKKALFFPTVEKLGDPFEGSISKVEMKFRMLDYEDDSKKDLGTLSMTYKKARRFVAINSWYMSPYESAGLWKLYLRSNEGIAIQSTFNRLKNSFRLTNYQVYIGKVKYIDYERDLMPDRSILFRFMCKRNSFKHEKELRALVLNVLEVKNKDYVRTISNDGLYIKVDLNELIDKVYLAPTTPKWQNKLVKSIMKKYELRKEILPSNLDAMPFY